MFEDLSLYKAKSSITFSILLEYKNALEIILIQNIFFSLTETEGSETYIFWLEIKREIETIVNAIVNSTMTPSLSPPHFFI